MQADLDRLETAGLHVGDLAAGQTVQVVEEDDAAVVARELRDECLHARAHLRPLEQLVQAGDQAVGLFGDVIEGLLRWQPGNRLLTRICRASRLKRDEGKSTYLIVGLDDPSAVAAVSQSIDGALANYPKPTTTQSEKAAKERELKDFAEIRRMLSAMLLATMVVSMFGAANSVSMSVRERTREVGILRSLGLRKAHVLGLLLAESALVAAAGGLVGLTAAAMLLVSEKTLGGMVPVIFGSKQALWGLGISLLVGLVGALVPSLNASRLRIVESLRFVD